MIKGEGDESEAQLPLRISESEISGAANQSVEITESNMDVTFVENHCGTQIELGTTDPHSSDALDNIITRLRDTLDSRYATYLRRKSRTYSKLSKGQEEARLAIGRAAHTIFEEISITPEELRKILPIASYNSSMMQSLAEEFGCEIPEVSSTVRAQSLELDRLRSLTSDQEKSIQCLKDKNWQLQSQVEELTARLATSLNQVRPDMQAQGEKNNCVDWSPVSQQLLSLKSGNKTDFQSRQPVCPGMKDGTARRQSPSCRQPSNASTVGESSSVLENSHNFEASHISHAMNGMFSVFKEVFKAQSMAEVPKYDGKSPSRALEMKYPMTVWSDRDRRDVLVNHLIGSARSVYKGLPEIVKKGNFAGIVQALKDARRDPCEKLKEIDEYDRLRMRSHESVRDFCCRTEDISRKIHPSSEWDFHLASKLYSCLQHWKDSYHMLAALEAQDGEAYDAVKKVALRLEKTQSARPPKDEHNGKFKPFKRRIYSEKTAVSSNED
ncbi:hypothetical protein COOONC_00612 [Cooperia oncophora]